MKLIEFEKIYREHIAPIYVNNQNALDGYGIHGCLHISRSLVICRVLANKMTDLGYSVDIDKITYAVAFHDIGRESNGIDYWENVSRNICYNYLGSIGYEPADCNYISNMIVKNSNSIKDHNFFCVFDTDVLEIMRPSTGIGVYNFNKSYLRCNHVFKDYDNLIKEIIPFILETEQYEKSYNDKNSLSKLIQYIYNNKEKYPTLYVATTT